MPNTILLITTELSEFPQPLSLMATIYLGLLPFFRI